jgi:hypothetical protein
MVPIVPAAQELLSAAEPLLTRVSMWTGRSWRHRRRDGQTRGDLAYAAVVALAEVAADGEGRTFRPAVPRLDDEVLADQLAVMVHDVVVHGDANACHRAAGIVTSLADALHAH